MNNMKKFYYNEEPKDSIIHYSFVSKIMCVTHACAYIPGELVI